jgi:tripartite-type tricarboxylate transporter receptor subunit TctC
VNSGNLSLLIFLSGSQRTLGTDNVAKSANDGYSILLTSVVHYLVPLFSKNVPYDVNKDFTPIAHN